MIIDIHPIYLTVKIALLSSAILLILCIFLAWWLSISTSIFKTVVEIICLLPLLLPPTVLGFYLLFLFNKNFWLGEAFFNIFGYSLNFSQTGIIIASIIYSLPFMLQPLKSGFLQVPTILIHQAKAFGKGDLIIFFKIILPNSIPSIVVGLILSFMHTMGEFGVVLMIGGNIPNQTQLISIKLYEEIESLNYSVAHVYSLILVTISIIFLLCLMWLNSYKNKKFGKNVF